MPRKRMIDPGIWRSEQVNDLSRDARLLFIGMFSNADDAGRLHGSAKFLRANIFPYDEDVTAAKVAKWRGEILSMGLAILYESNGREYLWLPTWTRHQRIDRPSSSTLPSPDEDSSNTRRGLDEGSFPIEDKLIEGNRKEGADNGAERLVFDHWNSKNIIKHRRLTPAIRSAIHIRLKDYSQAEMAVAIDTYAEILQGAEYYWSHLWTLFDFLKPRNIEHFMEPIKAREAFKVYENHQGRAERVADKYLSPEQILNS